MWKLLGLELCIVVSLLIISHGSVFAQYGAPWGCESGTPDMGSSCAGATARAQDASTAYTNQTLRA